MSIREALVPADVAALRDIVVRTGRFSAEEVDIAVELLEDGVEKGAASDYRFAVADQDGRVVGYACYGRIPCTVGSWDLYWIAVDPTVQGFGIGGRLLKRVEARVAEAGGARVFVDTSGRPDYAPTRAFYEASRYAVACRVDDFYAPGDAKVVYVRAL